MPKSVSPMRAVLGEPFTDPAFTFELKYDGMRALAYGQDDHLRIVTRLGNVVTAQFPELEGLSEGMRARSWIVDGEIAALDDAGLSRFDLLAPRIHAKGAATVQRLVRTRPIVYYVFDLLYLDGHDLRAVALEDRRALLRSVLVPRGAVRLSAWVDGAGEALFRLAVARGAEGVVGKRRDSRYESGRSRAWVKCKSTRTIDCVIAGFTRSAGRGGFGALALGLYEGSRLVSVGHVGAGFNRATLTDVSARLAPLVTDVCPLDPCPSPAQPTTWVRPELACTVRFASWTRDGVLRHPTFLHLRPDVTPAECTRDQDLLAAPDGRRGEARGDAAPHVRDALPVGTGPSAQVAADGRTLRFTHLNKVLFPREGYTKRQVLDYYHRVSDFVLPCLRDRPLTLKRYPDGVEASHFFQRRALESYPDWLETRVLSSGNGEEAEAIICNDRSTLLFLVNLGCIDHNGWLSRADTPDVPDFMLIDLDPHECSFDRVVEAACAVHGLLDRIGLTGVPATSGAKGMHVYVPLAPRYRFEQTHGLAHIIARLAAAERPDLFTLPRIVEKREKGKVYLDHPQNRKGSTIASPYSIRPVPAASVATPLAWAEVKSGLVPEQFTMVTVLARFERVGDLFAPARAHKQRLEPAMSHLDALLARFGRLPADNG